MGLKKYTLRRILSAFVTLLIVLSTVYFLFRLPAYLGYSKPAKLYGLRRIRSSQKKLTKEQQEKIIKKLRNRMGIPPEGASLKVRIKYFLQYMKNMLSFNFGTQTLPPYRPATKLLLRKLPYTLLLTGPVVFLQILLGLILGIEAGKDVGSTKDSAITIAGLSTRSLPSYWVAMLLLLLVFAIRVNGQSLYPATLGPTTPFIYREPFLNFLSVCFMYSLPIITLVVSGFGSWVYLMRNQLADVITEDYIFTARAKGLDESTILYKHALRNAILPVWTNIVLSIAWIWTGVVITETIFSLPGVGSFFVDSVLPPFDYAIEQMMFFFIALSVIGANLIADITYGILDPRVSYE